MDKDKFKQILMKLAECEAYNEIKYSNQNMDFMSSCKRTALNETHTDSVSFNHMLDYYKKNTEEFEQLYDTLIYRSDMEMIK